MYDTGRGVAQDDKEAVRWYRKAAEQGYAEAQSNLGFMYDTGQDVGQDYKEAVGWYRKAAEQGSAKAQYTLGLLYGRGQGAPKDHKEAYAWISLAAAQGYEYAKKLKESLDKELGRATLSEAENLSREYYKKYVEPFQ